MRSHFLLLLLFPLVANPANVLIPAAEIVGYGLFEAIHGKQETGYGRSALPADSVTNVRFTEFTEEIPGVLKTGFGVQYKVNSGPRGRPFPVTSVIKFPEGGLQVPGGRHYTESRENLKIPMGSKTFYGYTFDEPWEIVPGDWVFEVWHRDTRIIHKTFTVVVPPDDTIDHTTSGTTTQATDQ